MQMQMQRGGGERYRVWQMGDIYKGMTQKKKKDPELEKEKGARIVAAL